MPALLGLSAGYARGEAAPDRARSTAYYAVTGGVTAGLGGLAVLFHTELRTTPGADPTWFPGDLSVRDNYSPEAHGLSNLTAGLALGAPLLFELGRVADYRLLNATLVYANTISASLALDTAIKVLVARPRPYLHGGHLLDDPERYASFYSGHSSTAFAAAIAGSYLFSESYQHGSARLVLWGAELAFASATANLRVRAGKHYYSDVLVGMLAGVAFGIGVPVLHGARHVPQPDELVAAGAGFVAGIGVSELIPLDTPLGKLRISLDSLALLDSPRGPNGVSLCGRF